jgi:CRISPR/Cas system CMR-associated protein Cmr5 small subunit
MTAPAPRQTLDQQRAAHAWRIAEDADKTFGRQAKRLGPRILTAGLGPAIQFLIAKKEAPKLAEALEAWLLREGPTKAASAPRPAGAVRSEASPLIEDIMQGDSDRLRWLTAEALAYLAWLTRFCEARGLTEESRDAAASE